MTGDAFKPKTSYSTHSQAMQVLVLSSSSTRARSKRMSNQTMFIVRNPLLVLALLLAWNFSYCIFACLSAGDLSVLALMIVFAGPPLACMLISSPKF